MHYCIYRHIVRQADLRVENSIIPDSNSRHDTNMDAGTAVVSDECTQFVPAGINHRISDFYPNCFCIEPPVGGNRAGAKRTMCPDDRIAGVTHVELRAVPDIGFLDFCAETDHTIGAEMGVVSNKRTVADNRIPPEINRPSDHCIL